MQRQVRVLSLAVLCLVLAGCDDKQTSEPQDILSLRATTFESLPTWQADDQSETLAALRLSCTRILARGADLAFSSAAPWSGTTAQWQKPCRHIPPEEAGAAAARSFFETYFVPYEIWGGDGDLKTREGLFTGYYEPQLTAAPQDVIDAGGGVPLYARPDDMITVNLGDFKPDLKGEVITGRVDGAKLVPYYARAEIESGALADQGKEIVRVTDPVDAFFLHIQGSGQVQMPDGSVQRVGYAAQNGHPYYAIGRELIKRGVLTADNVSMQTIRTWLEENPDEAHAVMNLNPSYVFFQSLGETGPLGAEGVVLTPERSLAIDRRRLPYGAPVYIDVNEPENEGRLQRLMIAQDTGGAIRGSVRGDYFWGAGARATHKAGLMKSRGMAWILLPRDITMPDDVLKPEKTKRFGFF